MNRLKNWLLLLFTLLLVAAGAAMPFAASYMQDAQQAEADVRPFDSFSLTLQQQGADLSRILGTIANSEYYRQEISRAENAALTQGLALAAAEDLMTVLVSSGLLEKGVLDEFFGPNVYPNIVVPIAYTETETDGAAAVLPGPKDDPFPGDHIEGDAIPTWTITWDRPDNCYVWLDDASGKAIYIEIPGPFLGKPDGSAAYGEKVYAIAENWRAFLSDYYGTDAQIISEEWSDWGAEFVLSFPLGAGEDQEIFQLVLYLSLLDGFSVLSPYVS